LNLQKKKKNKNKKEREREKKMEERDVQLILEMLKEFKAESKAWREEMAAETRATQARMEMIKAEMKAIEERTAAMREKRLKANMNAWQDEMLACQEMDARPEEKSTSVDRKPEAAEERQVPENTEIIPIGEPRKKRRKDRKLAVERHRQMKEQTQGKDGCRRRLAPARRGTSHGSEVARKMQANKKMPRRVTVA
jgi:hypothetical protein